MLKIIEDYIYFLEATQKIALNTKRLYETELKLFLKALKLRDPSKVAQGEILSYFTLLNNKGLEQSTIKKKILVIKMFFNWLEEQGKINLSPFYRLRLNKNHHQPKKLLKTLTKEQIKRLLSPQEEIYKMKFKQLRNECIIRLFLATGIRRNELLNLKIKDLDSEKRELTILFSKTKRQRLIPFDKTTAYWLERYFLRRENFGRKCSNLFINHSGEPLKISELRYLLDSKFKQFGLKIKGIGAHTFRHTFATRLLENGADPKVVQELLGHADIKTTLGIYAHPSKEYIGRVYDKTNIFDQDLL